MPLSCANCLGGAHGRLGGRVCVDFEDVLVMQMRSTVICCLGLYLVLIELGLRLGYDLPGDDRAGDRLVLGCRFISLS